MEIIFFCDRVLICVLIFEFEKMLDLLKVLGILWNIKDDILMFLNVFSILIEKDFKIKRSLISLYLRVFDFMGLLILFLMILKLLF